VDLFHENNTKVTQSVFKVLKLCDQFIYNTGYCNVDSLISVSYKKLGQCVMQLGWPNRNKSAILSYFSLYEIVYLYEYL